MIKNKHRKWWIALALIAALCVSAAALYEGVVLPNSAELQVKRGLSMLEKAAQGGGTEGLEKAIAMMDDTTLLRTIGEAALEGEAAGDTTVMAFFVPSALERIAPKITPEQLGEIAANETYPTTLRTFLLEVTLYSHGTKEDGYLKIGAPYEDQLRVLVENDKIKDDIVFQYAVEAIPWGTDSSFLLETYEKRADNPLLQRRMLDLMSTHDPAKAQEHLFSLVENNAWIGLDDEVLIGAIAGLHRIETKDSLEHALMTTLAILEQPEAVTEGVLSSAIGLTGEMMGKMHEPGYMIVLMKYQNVIPDLFTHHVYRLSDFLFWEIDDLLRSENPKEVEWALRWVEALPFEYYVDSLKAMLDGEYSETAKRLIERAVNERHYMPRPDLATKSGFWDSKDYRWISTVTDKEQKEASSQ